MNKRSDFERAPTDLSNDEAEVSDSDSFDAVLREMAHVPTPNSALSKSVAPGSVLAGKFRVERRLGQGGMGAVYEVRHELTKHRRALKLLHSDHSQNPEIVQRFLDEASAAGRTGSPHLVETYDAGILPTGEPYLVMELLEGLTFGELINRSGVLSPELACELVAQAAEGMAAAHEAKIIHRDLKPENLFIVQKPDGPFVKILDFGISKFSKLSRAERHVTGPGAFIGTPAYMAPEQMKSAKDVDERADVFALGAVLFECLGGESPYEAGTFGAIVGRLMSGEYTPLESLRNGLSPELHAVVRRAIAANPAERTRSVHQLVEELAPFRRRDTPSYRALAIDKADAPEEGLARDRIASVSAATSRPRPTVEVGLILALGIAAAGGFAWWARSGEPTQRAPAPASAEEQRVLVKTSSRALDLPIATDTDPRSPEAGSSATQVAVPARSAPESPRSTKLGRASGGTEKVEPVERSRTRAQELGLAEKNPFVGTTP
ncbi:MAG: hypothetical protein RLZZ450_6050 [Pseudomonadota bacterium]|jgi:serine/threonine-protein kinase